MGPRIGEQGARYAAQSTCPQGGQPESLGSPTGPPGGSTRIGVLETQHFRITRLPGGERPGDDRGAGPTHDPWARRGRSYGGAALRQRSRQSSDQPVYPVRLGSVVERDGATAHPRPEDSPIAPKKKRQGSDTDATSAATIRLQLVDLLTKEYAVLRRGTFEPFENVQMVLAAWIVTANLGKRALDSHLQMPTEQLVSICQAREQSRAHTKTWARCAAGLLVSHPELKDREAWASPDSIGSDAEGVTKAVLGAIAEVALPVRQRPRGTVEAALAKLIAWTPPARLPADFQADTLSQERFSEGLRDQLERFNAELQYLTIKQIEALESSFRHRRLWIEGPAGSGKTIVAIEMAYRALRAGHTCVIVYRSGQFDEIFRDLLSSVGGNLILISHLDFVHVLDQVGRGVELPEALREIGGDDEPEWAVPDGRLIADLLIADDCGTYEASFRDVIEFVTQISHRSVLLAAPDQICGDLIVDGAFANDPGMLAAAIARIENDRRELCCPAGYVTVTLTENLRSARAIVAYSAKLLASAGQARVKVDGRVSALETTWGELEDAVAMQLVELLASFPASRIQVLVDPYLMLPLEAREIIDSGGGEPELSKLYEPITTAIFVSASGTFQNTVLDADVANDLATRIAEHTDPGLKLFYTDDEQAYLVTTDNLDLSKVKAPAWPVLRDQASPRVDARTILDNDALLVRYRTDDAIIVLPSPLFIGLEADAVLYVRNRQDRFAGVDLEHAGLLQSIRATHHFMAASRARLTLVDVRVR